MPGTGEGGKVSCLSTGRPRSRRAQLANAVHAEASRLSRWWRERERRAGTERFWSVSFGGHALSTVATGMPPHRALEALAGLCGQAPGSGLLPLLPRLGSVPGAPGKPGQEGSQQRCHSFTGARRNVESQVRFHGAFQPLMPFQPVQAETQSADSCRSLTRAVSGCVPRNAASSMTPGP